MRDFERAANLHKSRKPDSLPNCYGGCRVSRGKIHGTTHLAALNFESSNQNVPK